MRIRSVLVLLAITATACSAPDGVSERSDLPHRAPDGLLHTPALQAVVDAQEARDVRGLMVALDNTDPLIRARAAYGLASVRSPEASPRLIARLSDPEARVRSDAAFSLGQLDPATVMAGQGPVAGVEAALRQQLEAESDPEVRLAIIEAMGRVGGAGTMQYLIGMPRTDAAEHAALNLAIARGLVREVGPEASWARLAEDLGHADPEVRRAAAYGYDRVPDISPWINLRGQVRAALDGLDFDDEGAFRLLRPLSRAPDVYTTPRLLLWLRNAKDWRAREAAALGLTTRKNVETWLLLIDHLSDPSIHVRIAAANAMGAEPTPETFVPEIAEWIRSNPDQFVVIGLLLEQLGRSGQTEVLTEWMTGHDWHDAPRSMVAVRAAQVTDGQQSVDWLWEATEADDPGVRNAAFLALTERWAASRVFSASHDVFRDGFIRLMRGPDDRVSVRAAGLLGDSVLVATGGGAALRSYLTELSESDEVARVAAVVSALSGDPAPEAEAVLRERAGSSNARIARAALQALAARTGESVTLPALPTPTPSTAVNPHATVDWDYLAGLGAHPIMTIETDRGRIVLQLNTEEAPLTVQGITSLAAEGRYDGVPFHRVVSNFVVQGGDVSSGDGSGGPGFRLKTEAARTPFQTGALGMARTTAYDSEGSQFFITHSAQPHLDGYYTVFGQVLEGQGVVDQIAQGDLILSVTVTADPSASGESVH